MRLQRRHKQQRADKWEALWDKRFDQLCAYQRRHGHSFVPSVFTGNPALGIWVKRQRLYRKEGRLSRDRVKRLNTIGFSWKAGSGKWEKRFEELLAFRKQHGHCDVPARWWQRKLGRWVHHHRTLEHLGRLTAERRQRLKAVGFQWHATSDIGMAHMARWEKQFARLQAFHRRHRHFFVPRNHPGRPSLGKWLVMQRQLHRQNRLIPERTRKLEAIGFPWALLMSQAPGHQVRWEKMFARLRAFHRRHGHCHIRIQDANDPTLGLWAKVQRGLRRKGRLDPGRKRQLDALGFDWAPPRAATDYWNSRWDYWTGRLRAFHRRHGHFRVPISDNELNHWVRNVRHQRKRGSLSRPRIRQLTQLGFLWSRSG